MGATSVKVAKIPNCDFCKMDGVDRPAKYDGKTESIDRGLRHRQRTNA